MRIGLLAPPFETVPPTRYGGTERVLATLADALVDRGHDVTLFAAAHSGTRANLVPIVEEAVWRRSDPIDPRTVYGLVVGRAYRNTRDLDVMHNHLGYPAFGAARRTGLTTVTTMHWTLNTKDERDAYARFPEQPLVSISFAQRIPMPKANWIATVYHGYPRDLFSPRYEPGGYLAFCGRFTPEKGLDTAIQAALAAETPLKLAGRLPPADTTLATMRRERDFFQATLAPVLDHPLIDYVGELTDPQKQAFFSEASALLLPVRWPEPFGLVIIEALACGTPVIACPRGSVPELVIHGETGFHCETVEEFVEAIRRLPEIDRRACRRDFERRFLDSQMAESYERAYLQARSTGAEQILTR